MFNYETFRELCYKRGQSESAVAVACGVTRAAVTGWRKGSQPSYRTVERIAQYLGVDVSRLLMSDLPDDPAHDDIVTGFVEAMRAKNNLTDDEKLLLDIFRLLPDDRKQELLVCAMQIKTK